MEKNEEIKGTLEQTVKGGKKEKQKKEKTFYKKWWFWVIILAIVIVIGTTIIMAMAFNVIKGETGDLALEIHKINKDAIVYSSAGDDTLFIELRNWDNKYSNQLEKIISIIKNKVNNNELSMYNKFVTLAYMESSNKKDALIIRTSYSLPNFVKDEEDSKSYIIFEEYQSLYNTLNETMDGYTSLFNSIY